MTVFGLIFRALIIRSVRSKRNTTNVLEIMVVYRCEQKIVLFLTLCLGLAHPIAADQDRCLFHTNCEQCLAVDGCGWCDGYCLSGTTVTYLHLNIFGYLISIFRI